jgi:toxin ParE1/3/4
MRVRFHPAAELELSEAADYYDQESPGLGAELVAAIRIATDLVSRYPKMAPRAHGAVRRKMIDVFPYSSIA